MSNKNQFLLELPPPVQFQPISVNTYAHIQGEINLFEEHNQDLAQIERPR